MSCLILVGGGIGCGKTTLINYLLENKTALFENDDETSEKKEGCDGIEGMEFFVIQFDNLCSIEEQGQLMKSVRGLRDFRADLLMASERLITLMRNCENSMAGPLTERSSNLLLKLSSLNNFSPGIPSNAVIFVEDNFYYRSMRYDWLQIAKRTNLGFATIFLHCPLNVAMERNANRGYQIPEDRIEKMMSFMEFPDPTKFKWEKMSVVFDSSSELTNTALVDVIHVVKEALKNPVELVISEDKIEAQKICSKNVIHQTDRILRKIVSKIISNLKVVYIDEDEEDNFKTIISNLVNVRQKLLFDIKQGSISLPEDLVDKIENLGIESVLDAYEERLHKLFMTTLEEESLDVNSQFDNLQIID